MKRLGIFVFYDKDGIVDEYVIYLIEDLKKNVNELIIVVNGKVRVNDKEKLRENSDYLYIRENTGFDAGAYAEVLVDILGKAEVSKWDELVLCNDTFYGPFVPFSEIFNLMETKNYDFWGLDYIKRDFLSYIIMYFCVFRGDMLKNGDLYNYFRENVYGKINSIADAFSIFEVGLYYILKKKGYNSGCYTYTHGWFSKKRPDVCIYKYHLPIWKKRFFMSENYNKEICEDLFGYLEREKIYNIEYIKKNIQRVYPLSYAEGCMDMEKSPKEWCGQAYSVPQITYEELLRFVKQNSKVYIYGAGSFARATLFVFNSSIKEFKGFIVSEEKEYQNREIWGYPVLKFSKDLLNSAIIIALNLKHSKEVFKLLGNRENVIYFWKQLE